ncbi:MAG TPA: cell division protein ZipA C-terminal FtsZ-binding domain-containing protein [Steroidobacteraceae bacterium]|nr:cell division protein ZipA C-terminal FtsZ-binding domain-containing protein [Steroidobacteraceae bacterium]
MLWLRWILLLAGLVFIAILVWLERRKPKQATPEGEDLRWRPAPLQPLEAPPPAPDPAADPRAALPSMRAQFGAAADESVELPEMRTALDPPPLVTLKEVPPAAEGEQGVSVVDWLPAADLEAEPIVEWPPEAERRILSLRMVSGRDERMPGRAVRQCLEANGFRHGRFAIFHLSGVDGRAVLSVASLTRPGVLDPENMDFMRFSGLSLFAVLPGPLAPLATFDRLINVGQYLSARLGARLQDDKGAVLDTAAIQRMRQELIDQALQSEAPRPTP